MKTLIVAAAVCCMLPSLGLAAWTGHGMCKSGNNPMFTMTQTASPVASK